jgi:hypothetical protein
MPKGTSTVNRKLGSTNGALIPEKEGWPLIPRKNGRGTVSTIENRMKGSQGRVHGAGPAHAATAAPVSPQPLPLRAERLAMPSVQRSLSAAIHDKIPISAHIEPLWQPSSAGIGMCKSGACGNRSHPPRCSLTSDHTFRRGEIGQPRPRHRCAHCTAERPFRAA